MSLLSIPWQIANFQQVFEDLVGWVSEDLDACGVWLGKKTPNGYGLVRWGKLQKHGFTAHRAAWCLTHRRDIPKGMDIYHTCKTPECPNPRHVFAYESGKNSLIARMKRMGQLTTDRIVNGLLISVTERIRKAKTKIERVAADLIKWSKTWEEAVMASVSKKIRKLLRSVESLRPLGNLTVEILRRISVEGHVDVTQDLLEAVGVTPLEVCNFAQSFLRQEIRGEAMPTGVIRFRAVEPAS